MSYIVPPRHNFQHYGAPPRVISPPLPLGYDFVRVSGGDSDADEAQTPVDLSKTEKQCERYLTRYIIWNKKKRSYEPFDPNNVVSAPPPKIDDYNYFHLEISYSPKDMENPWRYLTNWSATLLAFLRSTIGGNFYNSGACPTRTFFPHLWHFKKQLEEAKAIRSGSLEGLSLEERTNSLRPLGFDSTLPIEHSKTFIKALCDQLGVLISFLEEEFQPVVDRLALQQKYGHIEFDLLPYFFIRGQQYATQDSDWQPQVAFVLDNVLPSENPMGKTVSIQLQGITYTWNGFQYVRIRHCIAILRYEGTVPISSLAAVSLTSDVKEKLRERGRLYAALSGVHYKSYFGNRIIVDERASRMTEGYDRVSKRNRNIVDEEASSMPEDWDTVPDQNRIIVDERVNRMTEGYDGVQNPDIPTISDEQLHMLPAQVNGFDLTKKTWESFNVRFVEPVKFDENAWDHLVLDSDTKQLIKGLVDVTCHTNVQQQIMSDVISGKGGGLIAVLHGAPGTGKTLTAESVAEHLRRPLYIVSSSELPLDAPRLEKSLRKILKLCTAWDAILLIDEADVLLEKRSLHEVQRNALVSVALKVFEYHRGVLFLTTNRISSFDEAFLSRFSLAIRYPDLDKAARVTIWRKFFELAGCRILGKNDSEVKQGGGIIPWNELEELAERPFNGRTVKNLVRTAQSLALSLDKPLSIEHVKVVVKVQEKFLRDFTSVQRPSEIESSAELRFRP